MASITRSVGGTSPNPHRDEVKLVQSLLNKHRPPPMKSISENGVDDAETKAAIEEFQKRVMKQPKPDGRVDPNGETFKALTAPPPPPPKPVPEITITVQHANKQPTGVQGLPGAASKNLAGRYESTITVTGGVAGTFKTSIYPDNMDVKGRIADGEYEIFLGFHNPKTPTKKDLVVRDNGFRAVVVINSNLAVPVISNLATKTTSTEIHIHNGWRGWTKDMPMSEGCLMITPDHWPKFISLFLKAFPDVADWTTQKGWLGKKIGKLVVKA